MRKAIPGALAVALVVFAAAPTAQQGPLVVPIVGSPAAQQQQQQSQQPNPGMPVATMPGSQPVTAPATASSLPMPGPQTPAVQPSAAGARKLQLTFDKGRVSLVAQNVTVREILGEWQRQNGCQFVNADKLSGGMVSFEFNEEPELRVIESLLRGAAGYFVGPRADTAQTGSVCGAVYILATSRPTSSVASYTPSIGSPQAAPLMQTGSPEDEIPPLQQLMGPQQVQPRPGPGQPQPQPPAAPAPAQASPFGPMPIGPAAAPGVGQIGGPVPPGPVVPAPNGTGRGGIR